MTYAAILHQLRREGHAVQDRAEAAIALSTEQGFPLFLARGTILRGRALVEQGHGEEGLSQLREGLAAHLVQKQSTSLGIRFTSSPASGRGRR